jgi:hypothetical protein
MCHWLVNELRLVTCGYLFYLQRPGPSTSIFASSIFVSIRPTWACTCTYGPPKYEGCQQISSRFLCMWNAPQPIQDEKYERSNGLESYMFIQRRLWCVSGTTAMMNQAFVVKGLCGRLQVTHPLIEGTGKVRQSRGVDTPATAN